MNKPARNLEKIYRTYNRKFFDGRLPSDTRIFWNDEIAVSDRETDMTYGLTIQLEDEDTKHRFFTIYIHPTNHIDKSQVRMTVLHEMCHVSLGTGGHGKRFEEEMKRIALRDAFKGLW